MPGQEHGHLHAAPAVVAQHGDGALGVELVQARRDGSFRVTNLRNGHSKEYVR